MVIQLQPSSLLHVTFEIGDTLIGIWAKHGVAAQEELLTAQL
jgi:hypothetical protein